MDTAVERAAAAVRRARHVVVFTGAGVSAESGIPTFRDALTGLWARFDAAQLATPQAFAADPELVWGWYEWRRRRALAAVPNAGHLALAHLATRVPKLTLITQNVDDLHERAGSRDVLHLHGRLHRPRCSACGLAYSDWSDLPAGADLPQVRLPPPSCATCGGVVRPGVVWFGEPLPERELGDAYAAAGNAEVLISVGTSGLVYPAARIPQHAHAAGATVIEVNPEPSGIAADLVLTGKAGAVLPALVDAACAL